MASDVIVPEVGELGMDVTFVRWLRAPGDEVAVGDPLFEVDTEKSVMVVEAYAAGTLVETSAAEGDTIAPRQVIGRIGDASDGDAASTLTSTPAQAPAAPPPNAPPASVGSPGDMAASVSPTTRPAPTTGPRRSGVSPRARRVAKKLGVDPSSLSGGGPDGLVTEADVRAAADPPTAAPQTEPDAGVDPAQRERSRRAVAKLTTASWQSTPHFFVDLEADVEAGLALARPTPLLCAAVARALAEHPDCNLAWDGDRPVRRDGVDLGLLVDTPGGLLIAVVDGAHERDLAGMAEGIGAAVERARSGKLADVDMGPRSLTVSNLGMFAVDRFTAVLPRPDILALAVGRLRTVPRWGGASFAPRKVIDLTLSVDHRALDGASVARFMTTLESILADPDAAGIR